MEYNHEKIKAFLSEKQNIALVAKLDSNVIGLIYGYSLIRMDGKRPQFLCIPQTFIRHIGARDMAADF